MAISEVWGPGRACPKCGAMVAWWCSERQPYGAWMNEGTMERHRCPVDAIERAASVEQEVECLCGARIYRTWGGSKLNLDGQPHVCPADRSFRPSQKETPLGLVPLAALARAGGPEAGPAVEPSMPAERPKPSFQPGGEGSVLQRKEWRKGRPGKSYRGVSL
jgi:hypothetical protein